MSPGRRRGVGANRDREQYQPTHRFPSPQLNSFFSPDGFRGPPLPGGGSSYQSEARGGRGHRPPILTGSCGRLGVATKVGTAVATAGGGTTATRLGTGGTEGRSSGSTTTAAAAPAVRSTATAAQRSPTDSKGGRGASPWKTGAREPEPQLQQGQGPGA